MFSTALRVLAFLGGAALFSDHAWAFEDTKVMPAGIRRLSLRLVNTTADEKTGGDGTPQGLAKPLEKSLTFKDILKSEKDPLKRTLSAGYLNSNGIGRDESVGAFAGDLKTRVTVFAPILSWGLTSRITVAAAMPIYSMATSPGVAFQGNARGQRFLDTLADDYSAQSVAAREAAEKMNDAVGRLQNKLTENGYRRLENWQATGPGDFQLVGKGLLHEGSALRVAGTFGCVAPTGRIDDPDNLIDKGFGDGQWDAFAGVMFDQPLGESGFMFNEYGRYTYQFEGRRTVRLATEQETIEVEKKRVSYKLGDKLEAGGSLQYAHASGFGGGLGYNYFQKWKDDYRTGPSAATLEKNTAEQFHQAEVEAVYTTVPAYRRAQFPVPLETKLSYRHQLASRNTAITHFVQFETGVFF